VKQSPVRRQGHIFIADVVLADPGQEERQALVLFLFRRVLVRLPRACPAVRKALRLARVEKHQSRREIQRHRNQVRVAAFQYPVCMSSAECLDVGPRGIRRSRHGNLVGFSSDSIEVENRRACPIRDPVGVSVDFPEPEVLKTAIRMLVEA
jgi:hypothetical protein